MRVDNVITKRLDNSAVEILFLAELPASKAVPDGGALTRVGGMVVRYFEEQEGGAGRVCSVEVWSEDESLTPSGLQRLGWSSWLAMADATSRRPYVGTYAPSNPYMTSGDPEEDPEGWAWRPPLPEGIDERFAVYYTALGESFQPSPVSAPGNKRPGRRGHPRRHYEQIAERYLQLRAEGRTDPTTQIAREMRYARSTVAGWVRKARSLGLLAPARRGRAG